jgi:hypothetical protein
MRVISILFFCFFIHAVFAQTPKATAPLKKQCEPLEIIVTAAIKGFSAEKRELLRSYEEDYDEGGIYYFQEYSTIFLWPGTAENFIRVSTSGIEDEQTISLISRHQKTDTKEKGYAQLKQLYSQLTPCSITPLTGQQESTQNNLLPITKALGYGGRAIMYKIFNLAGAKREVAVRLGLMEENKKYYAEMEVSLKLRDEEVIVPKCQPLNEVIMQLKNNFRGHCGKVVSSTEYPMGNGVSASNITYEVIDKFPGSSGGWIENSKLKKNGLLRRDSWTQKSWYSCYSYENAMSTYKKLYKQLFDCSIVSPAGRQLQLKADYSEPATMGNGAKRGIIDFKTSTSSEDFFISITLEKDADRYFVWLSISNAQKF